MSTIVALNEDRAIIEKSGRRIVFWSPHLFVRRINRRLCKCLSGYVQVHSRRVRLIEIVLEVLGWFLGKLVKAITSLREAATGMRFALKYRDIHIIVEA